jgi:signal transduction histidine kinase
MRIMLVDDTPANIDVLRKTLETDDYEIAVAPNGEMTLKIAPRFNPDLILLDVMMPGMDGYETCAKLKSMEETKDIPIIFITAKNEPEDIIKAFDVGGVDYITKPFRGKEVCARVQNQLALKSSESARKALIKDLKIKNIRLENLDGIKNNLLGIAAHDLRNPLASVRGFSEMLIANETNLGEDSKEMLHMIQDISNHMLDLVNDLLDYSVIESGKVHLERRKENLKTLLEKRVRLSRIFAEKKKIILCEHLNEIPELSLDSSRIIQVIDNLISNAIKYSPPESQVDVSIENKNGYAWVSVQDKGPGITAEDQKKLFQEFQNLSTKPTGGESSTGLGLAIVKKMVEAHDGQLKVDSSLGKGSTFSFGIPLSGPSEKRGLFNR